MYLVLNVAFQLFVGRKRTAFSWPANLETVTQDQLKNELFAHYNFWTEFDIEDTSLDFIVYDTKERWTPINDISFRYMLRKMVGNNMSRLSVQLLTPSKAFSSYNLNAVCQLYGLGDGNDASLSVFPELKCGRISGEAYERELTELVTFLEKRIPIMPFDGTNEATKSIYVYFFLHAAISIFGASVFTIHPEKDIAGTHGHGSVDYAIDSSRTRRTVGVTEAKNKDIKEGVAQNAVQLESCLVSTLFY